jgi:hypothetical protein
VYGHTISLTGDGRQEVRKQVAVMEAASMQARPPPPPPPHVAAQHVAATVPPGE